MRYNIYIKNERKKERNFGYLTHLCANEQVRKYLDFLCVFWDVLHHEAQVGVGVVVAVAKQRVVVVSRGA